MLERLREQFGVPGLVAFEEDEGGLTRIRLTPPACEAHIYLLGAHLTHWQPAGQEPVLWLSRRSSFAVGKPIRGGVPICHPWFAAKADDPNAPLHGFVRLMEWDVESIAPRDDGVEVVLFTKFSVGTAHWPGDFELRHRITAGRALTMCLETRNCGGGPLTISEALHSYFRVSDVRNVSITGLAGGQYVDKAAGGARRLQGPEPLAFAGETDSVYLETDAACILRDPGLARRIRVAKRGSSSTVIWNPWIEKARRMQDFGDDEWPGMVCIETANALSNAVTIAPGESHEMEARISIHPLTGELPEEPPAGRAAEATGAAATAIPAAEAPPPAARDWTRLTARIWIRARIADCFAAWATGDGLARWFLDMGDFYAPGEKDFRLDRAARPGDSFCWNRSGAGFSVEGTVTAAAWPDRFAFTFGPAGRCEVTFRSRGEETLVEVTQMDVPEAEQFLEGLRSWTFYLTNLKSVLEGGPDLRDGDPNHGEVVNL